MDHKDLEKFLKICRKQGVSTISFEGIAVSFGDLPPRKDQPADDSDEIATDGLGPDEMAFYHTRGIDP